MPGTSKGSSSKDQVSASQSSSSSAVVATSVPLSKRSVDLALAVWFIIFAFTTTFTDLHNFTASMYGVEVAELKHMKLLYPPKFLTDIYFLWAESVDPLLYQNPVWWQCIEWVNLCVLTPFAFIAPFAFCFGWESFRIPSIVVSSFTFYSLILCIGTTLYGPVKSADPSTFTGIYILYLTQPLVVIARLAHDRPFSTPLSSGWNTLLTTATLINFSIFGGYIIKWFALYLPAAVPAIAAPLFEIAKKLP